MADELSAERARREAAPAGLSGILSAMFDERADASWRVTRAWHAVNGDIERAHTTGTFVRDPRRGESGPVLVVYVDSLSRAEVAEIERACSELPPTLRESVSRAMSASYRLQRDK